MDACHKCGKPLGARAVDFWVQGEGPPLEVVGWPVRMCGDGHIPTKDLRAFEDYRSTLASPFADRAAFSRLRGARFTMTYDGDRPTTGELVGAPIRPLKDLVLSAGTRAAVERVLACLEQADRLVANAGPRLAGRIGRGRLCLDGPPGVGKTEIAHGIAERLGRPLLKVEIARLKGELVGQTEKAIARAFAEATRLGVGLFFDEIDSIASSRVRAGDGSGVHYNSQVNQLLTELDRFPGIVVATTNAGDTLDDAFRSRFTVVQVTAPTRPERLAIWTQLLDGTGLHPVADAPWIQAVDSLIDAEAALCPSAPPFTPREMEEVVYDALRRTCLRPVPSRFSRLDVQRSLEERLVARLSPDARERDHAVSRERVERERHEQMRRDVIATSLGGLRTVLAGLRSDAQQAHEAGQLGRGFGGVASSTADAHEGHAVELRGHAALLDAVVGALSRLDGPSEGAALHRALRVLRDRLMTHTPEAK